MAHRDRRQHWAAEPPMWVKVGLLVILVAVAGVLGVAVLARHPAVAEAGTTPGYTPPKQEPITVFIGDSYTQGAFASSPTKRWTSLVSAHEGWREANLGRGGTGYIATVASGKAACGLDFCPAYSAMVSAAVAANPSIVVIAGGQNDFGIWATQSDKLRVAIVNTQQSFRRALPKARIIVVGPSTPGLVDGAVTAYDAAIHAAADSIGAAYISLIDPPALSGDWRAVDGVHPNDTGYSQIAARVEASLAPVG